MGSDIKYRYSRALQLLCLWMVITALGCSSAEKCAALREPQEQRTAEILKNFKLRDTLQRGLIVPIQPKNKTTKGSLPESPSDGRM